MAAHNLADATSSLYYYKPSIPLAMAGAACFIAVAGMYTWRFIQRPAWHFWAMYMGLFMECIGFGARALSVYDRTNVGLFVVSYLTPVFAPSFMAAACYATFGRVVWWVTPPNSHRLRLLWCPTRFVTALFVLADLGSFFIQLLGAGAVATAYTSATDERQEKVRKGRAALLSGLALQVICSTAFVVICTRFLFVSRRWKDRPLRYAAGPAASWSQLAWTVNASSFLLMARTVYRLVEFTSPSGRPSYIALHEWPFWTFEAIPVLSVFLLFVVSYPGQHLPPKFLCLRLGKRELRNEAESSPPSYSQACPACPG